MDHGTKKERTKEKKHIHTHTTVEKNPRYAQVSWRFDDLGTQKMSADMV